MPPSKLSLRKQTAAHKQHGALPAPGSQGTALHPIVPPRSPLELLSNTAEPSTNSSSALEPADPACAPPAAAAVADEREPVDLVDDDDDDDAGGESAPPAAAAGAAYASDDFDDDEDEDDYGGGQDDSDDDFDVPPEQGGVGGLAARLANRGGGGGGGASARPQRSSRRRASTGVDLDAPISADVPEAELQRRARNIAMMQGDDDFKTTRAPAMDGLSVPVCLRPFKRPRGSKRTLLSDQMLRKKTLGVRRRGTGYHPGKIKPLFGADDITIEDAPTNLDGIPPHEPLILWEPPAGSPSHWKKIEVDPIMCHRLRPHQREGVKFCFDCIAGLNSFDGRGCILADDMGLGKTFQSVVLIWTCLKQGLPPSIEGSGYKPPPPKPEEPPAGKQKAKKKARKAKKLEAPVVEEDPDDVIAISSDSDSDSDDFAETKPKKQAPAPAAAVAPASSAMAVDDEPQPEDEEEQVDLTGADAAMADGESAAAAVVPKSPAAPVPVHDPATEQQEPMAKKIIVVCPTSLIGNWDNEITKWLSGGKIRTCPLEQGPKVKSNIEGFLGSWGTSPQVLIVSYETFRTHAAKFKKAGSCDLLICDEAHRLKNDATMTNQCLAALPCRRRILLSGTPMQNDLGEFYAMVNFINPGVLGGPVRGQAQEQAYFRRHFERPCLAGREPDATDSQRARGETRSVELSDIVNQFIIRRTNELLSAHLPPKLIQIVCCKLTPLQLALYMHFIENEASKKLERKETGEKGGAGGASTLVIINILKRLCNHPKLIYDAMTGFNEEEKASTACFKNIAHMFPEGFSSSRGQRSEFGDLIEFAGKFAVLDRLLHYLRTQTKDRIVLVSNYTQTLDLFQQLCRCRDYPVIRLDGSVGVAKRTKLVNQLNDMSRDEFVFLLSSKAGGCGLNLVGANRLILFDPDWNPANDKQAAARVWRDGQTKKVYEYRFLATGSIEEKVYQRQLSKEGLASVVSSDTKQTASSFSQDDLRELFTLRADCVSDTLDSFKEEKEDEMLDDSEEGIAAAAAAAAAVQAMIANKPKNPLSINPYDACDGYKPQQGQPGDEKLLLYGHHYAHALHTMNDSAMREAVGDDVSFVFSKEVDGCDLSKFH